MSVNSITTDATVFSLKPDQSAKSTSLAKDVSLNQTVKSGTVDTNGNGSLSSANNPPLDKNSESGNKVVRAMSHVVESYNQQGKVRIKFVDSHNNVIYQIPSEMVAKIEDQMMKPETFADTKG